MAASALATEMSPINTLVRLCNQRPVAVDAPGVADDEDRQEPDDEDEEEPGRVAVAQLVRERRPQEAGGDDGDRHGPAGLAESSLGRVVRRLAAGGHGAIFAHGSPHAG